MTLRRGFKSEAEALAIELRTELALAEHSPINVFELAEYLCIPALPISRFALHLSSASARYFTDTEPEAFSGTTIHHGYRRLVLFNDAHASVRQRSTIAHELAHALLGHPADSLANVDGERNRNPVIEEEASWLAGAILVPKAAAMRITFTGISVPDAAHQYLVSEQMIVYRLRVTGALAIANRRRRTLR